MASSIKFRVQAGALTFELEGPRAFVQGQIDKHRAQIDAILEEQAKLIKSGKAMAAPAAVPARRGRPPKNASGAKAPRGRRPGRQPVIIRESSLSLKPLQVKRLKNRLLELAGDSRLSKDASVFVIAHYLCGQVLKGDRFSAGDVAAAYKQAGSVSNVPLAASVDVVQMLRNLAASSIGKQWVARNADGTFSLTAKGKEVGKSGVVMRPRGRKPAKSAAAKASAHGAPKRRPGRPPKNAVMPTGAAPLGGVPKRRPGRPPKNAVMPTGAAPLGGVPKRRPGRPPKNAVMPTGAAPLGGVPKRRPGRPPKNAVMPTGAAPLGGVPKRRPGRPPKNAVVSTGAAPLGGAPKRRPGRPPKNAVVPTGAAPLGGVPKRRPGRPRKIKVA